MQVAKITATAVAVAAAAAAANQDAMTARITAVSALVFFSSSIFIMLESKYIFPKHAGGTHPRQAQPGAAAQRKHSG